MSKAQAAGWCGFWPSGVLPAGPGGRGRVGLAGAVPGRLPVFRAGYLSVFAGEAAGRRGWLRARQIGGAGRGVSGSAR
ncbi:MAG: hypothetical protein ACYCO9_08830 [Streptosporangiaceae bacterium]